MIRDFLHGLSLPFGALRLIFKTPRLLALSLLCAALASIALLFSAWAAWAGAGAIADQLISGDSGWASAGRAAAARDQATAAKQETQDDLLLSYG